MGAKSNRKYLYKNKLMHLSELAKLSVVTMDVLWHRLEAGWHVDDAVKMPLKGNNSQRSKGGRKAELDPYHRHAKMTTEESKAKGRANHKLEALIEKRMLEKELKDF